MAENVILDLGDVVVDVSGILPGTILIMAP